MYLNILQLFKQIDQDVQLPKLPLTLHVSSVQVLSSLLLPKHSDPPFDGAGLLQFLDRDLTQFLPQDDQDPQYPQCPCFGGH